MNNKINVLYIDDEPTNTELFEIIFSSFFNVVTGMDGFNGLEILEKNPEINVVISDMRMPGMNGLEFIKRAKNKYPDKRYYILSGFIITEEIRKSIEEKIILKYFMKPFDITEIKETIFENA
ncbi:MAG: response regulator [Prolixibacteraceae bacterium]|nr:response regulator [Prolixibacteraceae bacterium]